MLMSGMLNVFLRLNVNINCLINCLIDEEFCLIVHELIKLA